MDQGFYTKINWWNAAFISKKIRCRSRTRLLQNFPKRSCTVQIAILTPLRKEAKKKKRHDVVACHGSLQNFLVLQVPFHS